MKAEDGAEPPAWRRLLSRFGLALALVVVALVAWWLGLPQKLSFSHLGEQQAALRVVVAHAPALAFAVYLLAFALLTGALLPVALIMTLTSGAVFGPLAGGAGTVLGSTAAAVLTYLASRSALAPSLLGRAEHDARLQKVMQGFDENAFSYVLTLRLIPMFPFSLVNVAAGLAAVPLKPYALATLIGVVPSSFIYASLGSGIGRSLSANTSLQQALASPRIVAPLAALAVLSVVPLAVKWIRARGKT